MSDVLVALRRLVLVAIVCAALPAPAAHAVSTVTFEATADSWVSADAPSANHGSDTSLQISGSPVSRAYVRFNGSVPQGAVVTRTILRVYFPTATSQGVEVRQTAGGAQWNEGTITYDNAPGFPIFPGTLPNAAAGWRNINVLPYEPTTGETYVLMRPSAETVTIASRESLNKPQLIVEYTMPSTTPTSVCSATECVESKPWIYTQSWATTIADFNGDGREDHLVGRHFEGDRIYLQQPDGSFTPGFGLPGADRHTCVAGDVSRDGRVDLFCQLGAGGGQGIKQDELWIAQPNGSYVNEAAAWGLLDPYARGRRPILFDFDNDGLLDLYTTSFGPRADGQRSENVLWLNRGDPGAGGAGFVEQPVAATGNLGDETVAAGDWNRDGYRDFLVGGAEAGSPVPLHLFQNDAGTATTPRDDLLGGTVSAPRDATLTDLNRDGWDDLVIVSRAELQVRLNQACTNCARFSQVDYRRTLVDGVSVAVGDITYDGWKDLYVVEALKAGDRNGDDLLLAGPDWRSIALPQADAGVGDTAEIIDIGGRKNVIVSNGSAHRYYARGPVQFVSFGPRTFPRPVSAQYFRTALVPAFTRCTSGNATHGPPLAYPSCRPPVQSSSHATVGSTMSGSLNLRIVRDDPATPGDDADVKIGTAITDVRRPADRSDYTGELELVVRLRITDKNSPPVSGTVVDHPLAATIPCAPTPESAAGATCSVTTTADGLVPGFVTEGTRAIWALDQAEVQDGGADGAGATLADNTPFLREGVFIP